MARCVDVVGHLTYTGLGNKICDAFGIDAKEFVPTMSYWVPSVQPPVYTILVGHCLYVSAN